jgi:hypothetical protein
MAKEEPAMTGEEFSAWMDAEGLSYSGVQATLGIRNRSTISTYRSDGAPLTVALACSAVSAGLGPWRPSKVSRRR